MKTAYGSIATKRIFDDSSKIEEAQLIVAVLRSFLERAE